MPRHDRSKTPPRRRPPSPVPLVYLLCFASGLAGLTYEVIWLRLLAAALGNAAMATTAVLAAVMAGFGVGGLIAGRRADRTDPLRLYGALEIALGAFALAVPALAGGAGELAPVLFRFAGDSITAGVVRFLLAALVVFVPACLMGATVPVLTRFVELRDRSDSDAVGPSAAALYGLNTAGAAVGCGLAGYLLLGRLGIMGTGAVAAGIDAAVGITAVLLSFRLRRDPTLAAATDDPEPTAAPLPGALVLALAAISGAAVLALEGLWMRLLLIVFGHDVHAFSSMLAMVLIGLASGSLLYRLMPESLRTSRALVPGLFALLGVVTPLAFAMTGRAYLAAGIDILGLSASLPAVRSHEEGLLLQPVFAATLVVGPSLVAGAILPALCAAYRARAEAGGLLGGGSRVGQVMAANTVGAILGSLAPALVLVSWLGIQRSIVAVAAALVAAGLVPLALSRLPWPQRWLGGVVAITALALACTAAPYALPRKALARKIGPEHLQFLMYEEGRTGTVAVVRNRINGERQLFINGVNEVTTRLVHDQSFKLLGHLGLLLHPDPERVLVICLGAGLSAGAAASHPVASIDIVDLERSVVQGAQYFTVENNDVLDDERVHLLFDDGRHHLRRTEQPYDVMVVDSTHPRAVDSWILYTQQFYEVAASQLTDSGVFVQWVPLHGLSIDEFRIIVRTFLAVFPEGTLWVNSGFERYGQASYALLVGARRGPLIDRGLLAERLAQPRVYEDMRPWGLQTPAEVLECFVAGPEALRRWVGHLPLNDDDLPRTQFITDFTDSAPMSAARLLEVRHPVDDLLTPRLEPDEPLAEALRRRYLAQGALLSGDLERAIELCGDDCEKIPLYVIAVEQGPPYFRALRETYRDDPERLLEVAAGFQRLGHLGEAIETLEQALDLDRANPRLLLNLGLARMETGDGPGAREAFRAALTHNPDMLLAQLNLGLMEARSGQVDQAIAELEETLAADESLAASHAALGYALLLARDTERAEVHLRQALALDPRHRDARINLGRMLLQADHLMEAEAVFRVGWRLFPYDSDMLYNLGVTLVRQGRPAAAIHVLEAAMIVDPEDTEARLLLLEAIRLHRLTITLQPGSNGRRRR